MLTIPITPGQESTFEVDIAGTRYRFELFFNRRCGVWTINLSSAGTMLASGVPAVLGTELFQGDARDTLPRNITLVPTDDSTADATFDELGGRVQLVIVEPGDSIDTSAI